MPEIFAVLEGGGVKGIGHVGALASLKWREPTLEIKGYAGASAGAMVACLAAAGYEPAGVTETSPVPPNSMKAILDGLDFTGLLDGLTEVPLKTVQSLPGRLESLVGRVVSRVNGVKTARFSKIWKWNRFGVLLKQEATNHHDILTAFQQLWDHKGVYGTLKLRTWVDDLLRAVPNAVDPHDRVTFKSLQLATNRTLKVVATDIRNRVPKTYSPDLTPDEEVADAVLASMTLPLFFRPFPSGHNYYVDGGMLSNFPAWLFDEENALLKSQNLPTVPVLGIRLVPPRPTQPPRITTGREYLAALLRAQLDGTDFLQTRLIDNFVAIRVELPHGLNAWDFNLDDETKARLFDRGRVAAETALLSPPRRAALGLP